MCNWSRCCVMSSSCEGQYSIFDIFMYNTVQYFTIYLHFKCIHISHWGPDITTHTDVGNIIHCSIIVFGYQWLSNLAPTFLSYQTVSPISITLLLLLFCHSIEVNDEVPLEFRFHLHKQIFFSPALENRFDDHQQIELKKFIIKLNSLFLFLFSLPLFLFFFSFVIQQCGG